MPYRTKTYIAADWTEDKNAVEILQKWNEDDKLVLEFKDAHELQQARDGSLNCSIKRSLKERLDASKNFVLIVGKKTNTVRAGSCHFCENYNSTKKICKKDHPVDLRSYIEYECDKALEADIKIIVLYNSQTADKNKCPTSIRNTGTHVAMHHKPEDKLLWHYQAVKKAFTTNKE